MIIQENNDDNNLTAFTENPLTKKSSYTFDDIDRDLRYLSKMMHDRDDVG